MRVFVLYDHRWLSLVLTYSTSIDRLYSSCDELASPTLREQELIQKLEESSDEIETLLDERDKLLTLSSRLKRELQWAKEQYQGYSSDSPRLCADVVSPRNRRSETALTGHEKNLMNAILEDLSRSHDGESQTTKSADKPIVACFGKKPPMSRAPDAISSKNGYVSTCVSLFPAAR